MSKRIIPDLYITIQDGTTFDSIKDNLDIQGIIFSNVILGIKEATHYKHKEATIVELNSSRNYITLTRDKWRISLEKAQNYFTNIEDYETCVDIKKLIELNNCYEPKRIYRKSPKTY